MTRAFGIGLLLVLVALLGACAPRALPTATPAQVTGTTEVTVFAAASLTDAFNEIAQEFQAAHPGVTVVPNYAGSQALRTQLIEGARADVFASANNTEMKKVQDAGLADDTAQVFVRNRLVVIVPTGNPGGVESLEDLAKPGLKLVVAEPTVPVGGYTVAMLEKMSADPEYGADFGATVTANVVSQENNVKAVVAKVALGEADAGVVYVSDVTPDVTDKVETIEVPDAFNQIAQYPIVVLKAAPNPEMAQAFFEFVLAKDGGQVILGKWNFIPTFAESE